jgi:cobalamin biosynthesis protein CobT
VQLARLTQRLDVAEAKIVELEQRMLVAHPVVTRSPWFGAAAGGIAGVDVRRLSEAVPDQEPIHSALFDKVLEKVSASKSPALHPQAAVFEEEAEEAEEAEEETPDLEETDAVEEAEEADDEEEEEEEEAVEYISFEYKGVQYYRDDENQVYQVDEDGELDDTAPIGVWNPEKQKVLKYKV